MANDKWFADSRQESATHPEARPSELVAMGDGDTLDIAVSMVRRTIAGHEMIMFGYNGQYPGGMIDPFVPVDTRYGAQPDTKKQHNRCGK